MSTSHNMPLVTIWCITYNQEKYIRQCLDGFVMQQTSFKFEAIVHDDASTDNTAKIVAEYAERYPDIIKPLYENENQYSKRNGSIGRIMNAHMRGKYIAICEGDDYWTDPLKLQKQVSFLEANSNYSFCFHKAVVKTEYSTNVNHQVDIYNHLENRDYTGAEILGKWSVPTASVVYRNGEQKRPTDKRFIHYDIVLFLFLASKGKIYCLNDVMSVYRRHAGGITQIKINVTSYINHYYALLDHFGDQYKKILLQKIGAIIAISIFSNKSIKGLKYVFSDIDVFFSFVAEFSTIIKQHIKKKNS